MLKYLDPRGHMGRVAYFWSTCLRTIILTLVILFAFLISFLFYNPGPIDQTFAELNPDELAESIVKFSNASSGLLSFVIFAPISIRRAADIRMDLKWLVPVWIFGFIMPFLPEPMTETGAGLGILILVGAYYWVIELILLFKPGQTFKEWIRSQ